MNQPLETALLLVNPKSRQGNCAELQNGVDLLEAQGVHVIQRLSDSVEESRQLIDEYHREVQLVIVAGGDGTVSRLIDRIYQQQLPLAVLPLGTANDFARSLNIPSDLPAAFETILANRRTHINLGKANGKYFLNVAHAGLGVKVARSLTAQVKRRWGVFSYLKALAEVFSKRHSFRARIWVDGELCNMRCIQLAVGSGRFYGGGNIIDEQSSLSDGKLSLYAVKPQSSWELILLLPFLRSGKRQRNSQVFARRGEKIRVETNKKLDIHADGEPLTTTPVDFEVLPLAFEVITGELGVEADTGAPATPFKTTDVNHEHYQN